MRIAPFVLAAAAGVSSWAEPVHVPFGAWTMTRLDSGVLAVNRTAAPDDLILGCKPVDGPGTRLYVQEHSEDMAVLDGDDALAVLAPIWVADGDGTDMNREMIGMLLALCLDATVTDILVEAHRQTTMRRVKAIADPIMDRLDRASKPEPYITREEIEARFQPMRDRMAETEAVLDEMAQDALDDYREARRARRQSRDDDGYPLEPVTLPRYAEEPRIE